MSNTVKCSNTGSLYRYGSQLGADQESTPPSAPGVLMAPFFQGTMEHENYINETFKLHSPPKTSTSSETEDDGNLISILTALMISFNAYIPTQMSSGSSKNEHC